MMLGRVEKVPVFGVVTDGTIGSDGRIRERCEQRFQAAFSVANKPAPPFAPDVWVRYTLSDAPLVPMVVGRHFCATAPKNRVPCGSPPYPMGRK